MSAMKSLFEIKMYERRGKFVCRIKDHENLGKLHEAKSENPAEAVMLALASMGDAAPSYIMNADPANWEEDT